MATLSPLSYADINLAVDELTFSSGRISTARISAVISANVANITTAVPRDPDEKLSINALVLVDNS